LFGFPNIGFIYIEFYLFQQNMKTPLSWFV